MFFTTGAVGADSILKDEEVEGGARAQAVKELRAKSKSLVVVVREDLETLAAAELADFNLASPSLTPRADHGIPSDVINRHLRSIRRESRPLLFERLDHRKVVVGDP